jgi:YggT family protein
MPELFEFIRYLVTLYIYVIIASAILSLMLAFNVVNSRNQFVQSLWQAMLAVTEPLLRPIRRLMPNLGVIDFSPVVLIIACVGIRDFLIPFLYRILT